ncbi:MAG: hypothetical protein IPO50_05775 [Sphingomonadales bacterium]|nr:hypothetical protein [Sphingomonadales bacterium]
MFERLKARAERVGRAAVLVALARLARQAALPPDVRLETREDGLTLSGRALRRRMLDDPRLRGIGQ